MNDDQPFLTDDELALHAQVKELRLEHADLDASIEALAHMPIPDQLLIVERPTGITGHSGGQNGAFNRQFGGCLLEFFAAPKPGAATCPPGD